MPGCLLPSHNCLPRALCDETCSGRFALPFRIGNAVPHPRLPHLPAADSHDQEKSVSGISLIEKGGLAFAKIQNLIFAPQTLNRGELLIMTDKQLSESMCLQDVAMNLLAIGYSLEEAAQVLGVTVGTIYNWQRRDASFKPTVKNLRRQVDQQRHRK